MCWGGNIPQQERGRLDKMIKKAEAVIGRKQMTVDLHFHGWIQDKLSRILTDETHPLRPEIDKLRIERSGRLSLPAIRTTRYYNYFIPQATIHFNRDFNRST